jgi:alkylation response protein AidB-like acyl-CoA dehydrogenase
MAQHDYEAIRTEVRKLVDQTIRPNAEKIDREGTFPRENLRALGRAGWNSILFPEKLGGLGLDHVSFAIAAEEIATACPSTGLIYVMHVSAAQTLLLFGTDDQKQRWLKPTRDGVLGTFSTSEKASGGHFWFNLSQAKRAGRDYLIDAEKSFTTSSGQADYYVTTTRSPDAKNASDVTWFIIDGKDPGIKAGPWDALGVRGNHSGPIRYENVRVPERDRLGAEGQGKEVMFDAASPPYLLGLGAVWHGLARGALASAVDWATRTVHRDFNVRLADYQVLRQELGAAKVAVEGLAPWQERLARKLDTLLAAKEPQGPEVLPLVTYKVQASEVAARVSRAALELSGGYGYKRGPIERAFRDARAGIAMGPSNNIAREWLGKSLVGLPLELWEVGGE